MTNDGPGAPAPGPAMLVATKDVLTSCGWVSEGRIVAADDPMLAGVEDAFVPILLERGEVEQATAAPGERRQRRRG
jgi:hypothetical protein